VTTKLQVLLWPSKNQMWSDYLKDPSRDEVVVVSPYTNTQVGMMVDAVSARDGKEANTATEIEVMPRCELLSAQDGIQYYEGPSLGCAHPCVA